MEELLLAFAAKALNIEQDEIKELLESDGGLEALHQKHATHVKSVKDTGYKAGERKVNTQWEAKVKEAFNLQTDTKGTELIDIAQEAVESKPETSKELTEAQLKKLPYVLSLEKKAEEAERLATEKWQKVLAEKEEAFQQKELFSEVKANGLAIFESLKPVLSQDPQKATAQKNIFLRELENYKYMKTDGGLMLLDKEGNRMENEQGYPVKFDEVVRGITTTYFDLQAAEPKASSARKPDEQTTPQLTVPKNREEYVKVLSDSSLDPAEKQKVIDAYNSRV